MALKLHLNGIRLSLCIPLLSLQFTKAGTEYWYLKTEGCGIYLPNVRWSIIDRRDDLEPDEPDTEVERGRKGISADSATVCKLAVGLVTLDILLGLTYFAPLTTPVGKCE